MIINIYKQQRQVIKLVIKMERASRISNVEFRSKLQHLQKSTLVVQLILMVNVVLITILMLVIYHIENIFRYKTCKWLFDCI